MQKHLVVKIWKTFGDLNIKKAWFTRFWLRRKRKDIHCRKSKFWGEIAETTPRTNNYVQLCSQELYGTVVLKKGRKFQMEVPTWSPFSVELQFYNLQLSPKRLCRTSFLVNLEAFFRAAFLNDASVWLLLSRKLFLK